MSQTHRIQRSGGQVETHPEVVVAAVPPKGKKRKWTPQSRGGEMTPVKSKKIASLGGVAVFQRQTVQELMIRKPEVVEPIITSQKKKAVRGPNGRFMKAA